MMQKAVIRVPMVDHQKSRKKALQIAVTASGVESVALKGNERDQIELVGDGIDTVELTRLLRKKVGCADLLSLGPAKQEKIEEEQAPPSKKEKEPEPPSNPEKSTSVAPIPICVTYPYPYSTHLSYPVYVISDHSEPSCNIL